MKNINEILTLMKKIYEKNKLDILYNENSMCFYFYERWNGQPKSSMEWIIYEYEQQQVKLEETIMKEYLNNYKNEHKYDLMYINTFLN